MDIILILIFLAVFLASYLYLSRPKGLPPGPLTLPLIGSFGFLRQLEGRLRHVEFTEAAKKYGDVFCFRFGKYTFVVLNGYEAVYQALVKHADVFSDRPNFMPITKEALKEGRGVLMQTYNHQWKTMRRFTLQTLRDFGVGKSSLEDKIIAEVEAATSYLNDKTGQATEMAALLQMVIGNVIYGIIFGRRYAYNDPEFEKVRTLTNIAISGQGLGSVTNFFPQWFTKLFNRQAVELATKRRANFRRVREYVADMIQQHEDTYDENNIRDFVDLYIQISRQEQVDNKEVFTMGNMRRVILDLFFAGSETTSTTLDWAFLYMAEYPEIQRKCQQEIEENFGDKPIEYSDRSKLTYTEATIMEIQRLASIVPLSVTHATLVDTKLMGYNIPKQSFIIPNLYSVSLDPNYWKDPTKFNPYRFISDNGKLIKKDAFTPFSLGPRTCLGEPLARMELFLVFVNLLQRFTFERENPNVKHSFEPKRDQITSAPLPYKVKVNSR